MAVFVPKLECDVFVSFAMADNELTVSRGTTGWVSSFIAALDTLLGQKLGSKSWGAVKFSSAQPGQQIPADTRSVLSHSGFFVLMLSEAYLNSVSCQAELSSFVSNLNGSEEAVARIAVVLVEPIPRERWPDSVRHLLAYELLKPTGHGNGSTLADIKEAERNYSVALDDLSTNLARRLKHLRTQSSGENAAKEAMVFLAQGEKTSALRESVKRYLVQDGFRVLPEYWYPREVEAFRAATIRDLQRSVLFAQLLSEPPFEPTPHLPGGYAVLQHACAEEVGTEILQWRSLDLDLSAVADPDHLRLLQGEHVHAVGIEEFKRKVVQQARILADREVLPQRSEGAYVVVNANDVDLPLAEHVGDALVRGGLVCDVESQEDLPLEDISATRPSFAGLLIVYGTCPAIWVRQQLWRYRKAMARSETPPPICAVYEGPPPGKEAVRFKLPTMKIIDGRNSFDESSLEAFIAAVQGRAS